MQRSPRRTARNIRLRVPRRLQRLGRLMYRHTVPSLVVLLCAGVIAAVVNMATLSSQLISSQAELSSALYINSLQQTRTYYSENVVKKLKNNPEIKIDYDHLHQPDTIPLPATFLIDISKAISNRDNGVSFRLLSNHPFAFRKDGGPHDSFERQALTYLEQHPNESFSRIAKFNGRESFRYARADIMKASCVACHNTHPESTKRDWKVGDVRGIVEVTTPIEVLAQKTRSGLLLTLISTGSLLALATLGVMLVVKRLKRISQELESKVQERTRKLRSANLQLREEQQKSSELLLNILPESIVERIQQGETNISDSFNEASILFADIVNFTPMSEDLSSSELIEILSTIFSRFDALTEQFGLEKIKTIGDSYMVASGLPLPREDHAEVIADLALAMQAELKTINEQLGRKLNIRIGINSGPVVAGVIGQKKFIYDLWGDTVNVAARMESHGLDGAIQVSQSTHELLRGRYLFEGRGLIPIKGKGTMKAYMLKAKRSRTVNLPDAAPSR